MASRAHVIHDYSFGNPPPRQRRAVWIRPDEEVVLPRSRDTSGAGALLISALVASALTTALAYAVYVGDVPKLAATEAAPLSGSWEPDRRVVLANVTNLLSGPAFAVPSKEGPVTAPVDGWADVPLMSAGSSSSSSSGDTWSDSAHGMQPAPIQEDLPSAPQLTPESTTPSDDAPLYPNPTTTPPEGFAPPSGSPPAAPATSDPENPYVDR